MNERSFDSNIVIDLLNGIEAALAEIKQVDVPWISRLTWIEVMSKEDDAALRVFERYLAVFRVDEVDDEVSRRSAALRRDRPSLKLPDAVILASAQIRGRTLVTRNIKDFPANMPGIRIPYTL